MDIRRQLQAPPSVPHLPAGLLSMTCNSRIRDSREANSPRPPDSTRVPTILWHGFLSGLVSGLMFSGAASVAAVLQGKPWDAPVRLVAAVALGPSTFTPGAPILPALLWGMAIHLGYTIATGALFAWMVAQLPALRRNSHLIMVAALVYTLAWWLLGFYVVAPLFGWYWFAERTQFLPQLILQVGVWGGALGVYFVIPAVQRSLAEHDHRTGTKLAGDVTDPYPTEQRHS